VKSELVPGSGGVFEVAVDNVKIFSKKELGRFPEDGEILAADPTRELTPGSQLHEPRRPRDRPGATPAVPSRSSGISRKPYIAGSTLRRRLSRGPVARR